MLVVTDDIKLQIETWIPHWSKVTFKYSKNVGLVYVRAEENSQACMFLSHTGVVGLDSNTRTYFAVTTKFDIW